MGYIHRLYSNLQKAESKKDPLKTGESFTTLWNEEARRQEHDGLKREQGFPEEQDPNAMRYQRYAEVETDEKGVVQHPKPPWVVNEASEMVAEINDEDAPTYKKSEKAANRAGKNTASVTKSLTVSEGQNYGGAISPERYAIMEKAHKPGHDPTDMSEAQWDSEGWKEHGEGGISREHGTSEEQKARINREMVARDKDMEMPPPGKVSSVTPGKQTHSRPRGLAEDELRNADMEKGIGDMAGKLKDKITGKKDADPYGRNDPDYNPAFDPKVQEQTRRDKNAKFWDTGGGADIKTELKRRGTTAEDIHVPTSKQSRNQNVQASDMEKGLQGQRQPLFHDGSEQAQRDQSNLTRQKRLTARPDYTREPAARKGMSPDQSRQMGKLTKSLIKLYKAQSGREIMEAKGFGSRKPQFGTQGESPMPGQEHLLVDIGTEGRKLQDKWDTNLQQDQKIGGKRSFSPRQAADASRTDLQAAVAHKRLLGNAPRESVGASPETKTRLGQAGLHYERADMEKDDEGTGPEARVPQKDMPKPTATSGYSGNAEWVRRSKPSYKEPDPNPTFGEEPPRTIRVTVPYEDGSGTREVDQMNPAWEEYAGKGYQRQRIERQSDAVKERMKQQGYSQPKDTYNTTRLASGERKMEKATPGAGDFKEKVKPSQRTAKDPTLRISDESRFDYDPEGGSGQMTRQPKDVRGEQQKMVRSYIKTLLKATSEGKNVEKILPAIAAVGALAGGDDDMEMTEKGGGFGTGGHARDQQRQYNKLTSAQKKRYGGMGMGFGSGAKSKGKRSK